MNTVQIRDENQVYQIVQHPAILYDKRDFILLKIGEKEKILKRYEKMRKHYIQSGLEDIACDLAVLELPPNQKLIDDLFQYPGRFQRFVEQLEKGGKI